MDEEKLIINSRDELFSVDPKNIVYFEAAGNYTRFMTLNKLKGTIGVNLSKTEHELTEQLKDKASVFMRIGKRFIINTVYIYCVNVQKQHIILSDLKHFAFQLPVSKDALKKTKELIVTTYKRRIR